MTTKRKLNVHQRTQSTQTIQRGKKSEMLSPPTGGTR